MLKQTFPVIHTVVFRAAPGGGNPCPVVFGAAGLAPEQMRAIATRYMAETAFVLPAKQDDCAVRLRYFVPNHEMEMCVHGTMGAVAALAFKSLLAQTEIKIATPVGTIPASWAKQNAAYAVTVGQLPPIFSDVNAQAAEVAAALNISEGALATDSGPLQSVSTSRAKLMVPLRDRATLDALRPNFALLWRLCDEYNVTGFYPFAQEDGKIYARQFPKRAGYDEDPATGLAASALGAYLVQYDISDQPDGWHTYEIHQGHAMGRPSVLHPQILRQRGVITAVRIKGEAVVEKEELLVSPF